MLSDKDAGAVAHILDDIADHWYTATLVGSRGRSGQQLAAVLRDTGVSGKISYFDSVGGACRAAKQKAVVGDRVVVFGSFY
jgi:dihydrofolate synthase/folylpolyglutamate synthase